MEKVDIIIIGAGIVGAAVGFQISQRWPNKKILILEKEQQPALHQTGRNSGVIHAGVYYAPGSLKARYCREGLSDTYQICQQFDIAHQKTGKMIVATNVLEEERLQALFLRCQENDLDPTMLSRNELHQREPNITGTSAMFVSQTGIVDYKGLTACLLQQLQLRNASVQFGQKVKALQEDDTGITVMTDTGTFASDLLINCAGLQSDRIIKMLVPHIDFAIVPFKGEYFRLPEKYNGIVNHLIYPVPDPDLPFLGVHLTKMIDGSVTVGPNAVLAFGREAYGKTQFNMQDLKDMLRFEGFTKVIKQNWKSGCAEFKNSLYKPGYLRLINKYCPQIKLQDLLPYPPGIRAQAVSKDGQLIHDFKFVETERSLHVGNAPSPAATSSMPIARAICDKLADKM